LILAFFFSGDVLKVGASVEKAERGRVDGEIGREGREKGREADPDRSVEWEDRVGTVVGDIEREERVGFVLSITEPVF
jgi:hypothetical protein